MVRNIFLFFVLLLPKTLTAEFSVLPLPTSAYGPPVQNQSLWEILWNRIEVCPFNFIATTIFFLAILHTFFASKFEKISQEITATDNFSYAKKVFFHFLGEIEAIFGIWLIPLIFFMLILFDWHTVERYFQSVSYTEPLFIVVIMSIAASNPVMSFAQSCMEKIAKIGHSTVFSWWFSILTIGPLLGSIITEPAAITISAMLLAKQFFDLNPSLPLKYATLGLLFVNISVGGTLTNFAAPPVLMVANKWNWDLSYMFSHFGIKAIIGIVISNLLYALIFKKEFHSLNSKKQNIPTCKNEPVHGLIIFVHLFFLAWTVISIHTPSLFIIAFLFFIAFTKMTPRYQSALDLKSPILVGFFLAGLVTHGGLQQWWIEPILGKLNELTLFVGATALSAFNDNAAITYLASLVTEISSTPDLQRAVVYGAVTGGGLTLIANAPNPAGQSILQKYFGNEISPSKLFLGAIAATLIMAYCFTF